ncbi:acyl carrier protein [Pseudomonas sp. TH15]|uniref:acyl carrier protein n=1 Tax=Pseudomonas sp. TH15 TaxID=2796381 RepID=UPI001911FDBF|nr:acyl carrier protein [Pseudomonas sp. TH15]MBK5510718.1 acyl carrier protein [Pseudomonas sp. TH15]
MSIVEDRVIVVISQQLGLLKGEVRRSASFVDDLGADSLDTVELIMALEDEFQMEISDEEAERITTVEQALNYVNANVR